MTVFQTKQRGTTTCSGNGMERAFTWCPFASNPRHKPNNVGKMPVRHWINEQLKQFFIFNLIFSHFSQLNHWTFNDLWYFRGNIHLHSKEMLAFRVCLVFDEKEVEKHAESYGAIQFNRIVYEFSKEQLKVRHCPILLLQIRELKSKLPRDLLPMCKTSTNLSEFDEKLHGYCVRARQKVKQLKKIWRKTKALIKEENGYVFQDNCVEIWFLFGKCHWNCSFFLFLQHHIHHEDHDWFQKMCDSRFHHKVGRYRYHWLA